MSCRCLDLIIRCGKISGGCRPDRDYAVQAIHRGGERSGGGLTPARKLATANLGASETRSDQFTAVAEGMTADPIEKAQGTGHPPSQARTSRSVWSMQSGQSVSATIEEIAAISVTEAAPSVGTASVTSATDTEVPNDRAATKAIIRALIMAPFTTLSWG